MIHIDLTSPRWWSRRWLVTVTAERPIGSRLSANVRCRKANVDETVRRLVEAARIWNRTTEETPQ